MTMEDTKTGASGSGEPVDDIDSIVASAALALRGAVDGTDESDASGVTTQDAQAEEKPVEKKINPLELVIPEDAEGVSGFFKGKPVVELVKSHKFAEAKIEEQGRELNRLRAEMAAKDAAGSVIEKLLYKKQEETPKGPPPLPDPLSEPNAYAQEIGRRNEERTRQIIEQDKKEASERAQAENVVLQRVATANNSITRFRQNLPPMDDKKFDRLAVALINEVKDHPEEYPDGLLDDTSYFSAYKTIIGELPQYVPEEQQEQVVPDRANPPAFGKAAPRPTRTQLAVPSLRREQEEIVDRITSTMLAAAGISGDELEAAKLEVMGEAAKRIASPRRTA